MTDNKPRKRPPVCAVYLPESPCARMLANKSANKTVAPCKVGGRLSSLEAVSEAVPDYPRGVTCCVVRAWGAVPPIKF